MKNLFVGLIATFVVVGAMAENTNWEISKVTDRNNATVGYIYHTGAIGTQINARPEKVATSLRLVCSTLQKNSEPLVVIFWNTLNGNIPQTVEMHTDKRVTETLQWDQEGQVLMRSAAESKKLIQAMKTGNNISFLWTGTDSIRRNTNFNLRDFKTHLNEFNTLCKTEL